jgi:thioesterase domain-containing protein
VRSLAALIADSEVPEGAELVRLDDGTCEQRLFFICGVHLYQALARQLADRVSSYGVFLPYENALVGGAGAQKAGQPTVAEIAEDYIRVLRAAQPHGPYRLAGVSFGGVLALEIARKLRLAGEAVEAVVLLDSLMRESIRRAGWRVALEGLRRGRARITGAIRGGRTSPSASAEPQETQADAQVRAARDAIYLRAIAQYQPHAYDGAVLLVRALDLPLARGETLLPNYGWDRYLSALTVVDVPGDHVGILRPPHLRDTARCVRAFLGARLDGTRARR